MSRPPSIKQQLLALYRTNRKGAASFGQQWAVDHYTSLIRELEQRGSGPLPAHFKRYKNEVRVYGEVALWGDVHVHERGYRAEWALPLALHVTESMPKSVRLNTGLAAETLGLPIVRM